MSPLLIDHNNAYIVVVVDSYSGLTMLHAIPANDRVGFRAALEQWFGIFGWPTLLYTDGAKSFVARTVNELLFKKH